MPKLYTGKLPSSRKLSLHPLWNIWLLTIGAGFMAFGSQAVAAHHGFLTGGVLGLSLLTWYGTGLLTAPIWNILLNLPLLLFGWFKVSRRFVWYSLYGTLATSAWGALLDTVRIPVENDFYAAILAGVLVGIGIGIMLRSQGSSGGLDMVSVYLNKRWNFPIGQCSFAFNIMLFLTSVTTIPLDMVIVSGILVFISANTTDFVQRLSNRHKTVFIITGKGQEICQAIMSNGGRATIVPAFGAYTHESKEVVITIASNFALRYLEDLVASRDPQALFAVQNSFYIAGGEYKHKSK